MFAFRLVLLPSTLYVVDTSFKDWMSLPNFTNTFENVLVLATDALILVFGTLGLGGGWCSN